MAKCWEQRGCDDEMQADCPHAVDDAERCPVRCAYAACDRSTHQLATDPAVLLSATVDRGAALRTICVYCEFFLVNGPRV